MRNVIVVGSGCAGNTAALYTARANLKPLVVAGHEPGGQLSLTTLVENFPGFPEGIDGPTLVENIKKQAEHFGAEYLHGTVIEADLSKRPFRLNIDDEWHEARTVIIASGRFGALAESPQRAEADRPRRQLLRHLRRLFLSRQEDHGDRRRRYRHGRGQLSHAFRRRGGGGASPRYISRVQDHAGPRPQQSQDQVSHRHRGRRRLRRRPASGDRRQAAQPEDGRNLGCGM